MAPLSVSSRVGWTLVAVALVAASCAGGDDGPSGPVTVFAASSLTDAMTEIADAFERATGVEVRLSFGPSSGLREQVLAGAPADVFASADPDNMERLVDAGAIDETTVLARNHLQIAVPAGNPAGVDGLGDFARSELFIGLCAPEVPCGAVARRALRHAGVEPAPDTEATDVRALLTQVASGDLDAGLVYVTDVRAAGAAVDGIALPADADVSTDYLIGTLGSGDDDAADEFVDFAVSDAGRAILSSHGFGSP